MYIYIRTYVYTYIARHLYINHLCLCASMRARIYAYVCICVCACACVCVYVYICACLCLRVCVCVCTQLTILLLSSTDAVRISASSRPDLNFPSPPPLSRLQLLAPFGVFSNVSSTVIFHSKISSGLTLENFYLGAFSSLSGHWFMSGSFVWLVCVRGRERE